MAQRKKNTKPKIRLVTHKRLLSILSYDRATGIFRWKVCQSKRNHVGDVAGSIQPDGYRIIQIDYRPYFAQRLAWFYVNGRWPKPHADHKNGNRDANWINNIREATKSQNSQNSATPCSNTSGYKGVSLASRCSSGRPRNKPWKSQIRKNGNRTFLGYFSSKSEANIAYRIAAKKMHGKFASNR